MKITDKVHAKGSFMHFQLWAPGRVGSNFPDPADANIPLVSASDVPLTGGATPTNLDAALAVHPRRPVIRWQLDFDKHQDEAVRTDILARFAAAVETGMPNAHEERRLVFEEYAQIKSDGDRHLAVTCFWVVPVLPIAFITTSKCGKHLVYGCAFRGLGEGT
jgi:hypothetical protein